ncbi:Sel1 repeat protein [Helicobacter pylori HP260AFi]|uniref:beta-lactamase n=2 Tax=Helicobacter pylori TaxID=210 RepID=A0ABC9S7W9_HELPX|nr:Sel1 repeat protein [Helicobacter pylori GAM260ASi]EMH27013.1 Sel1 repeat protein [Helicobacter pylori GAM268Bii]EMH64572.1 Sel1 repeat protein [Helicobacter pylori HP260AFii]EMH65265.1 Sel1 repeat protein [Helicobacter pylori HP260AFi]EMH68525.1 Sel1 repeat protein [Helicobacter pylori HP260ASii]
MAQIVKGTDMFEDFYRTTLSFLRPFLLLLGLLLPFSLCIADEYISINDDWDEIARNHKTYYFENGLDHFNQGQYKQAFKDFRLAQEYGIGLGSVYLAKMYLEGKGVKVDYKKAQLYAKNAIKGYGSGLLGGTLILGRMQAEGLGMKKDLKQALKTCRHVVRMFSNKSTNFTNNFRLPNLAEFTSMLIGSRFIDLSGLSANPIKFGKKFGILVKKALQIKDKTLLWEDIAEISSNIFLLKQQMGEILYRIGIAYKEGLGTRKKKDRAKKFLQKSAEFGYEKAMEAL